MIAAEKALVTISDLLPVTSYLDICAAGFPYRDIRTPIGKVIWDGMSLLELIRGQAAFQSALEVSSVIFGFSYI